MIESINPIGLDPAQATSTSPAADPKASAQDMRDFAAAMERNGGAQPAQASEAVAVQAPSQTSEGLRTLLNAFDSLNGGANSIQESASKLNVGKEFSPSQVIELTMQCHQFMFQTQLTSNVANRTSDGIQQLFRQQS